MPVLPVPVGDIDEHTQLGAAQRQQIGAGMHWVFEIPSASVGPSFTGWPDSLHNK